MANVINDTLQERKITFGEKEYIIKPDLETSFKLTKYRNKNTLGIEITDENKNMLEKIFTIINELQESGEEITYDYLKEKLTTEELNEFLKMTNNDKTEPYSLADCKYILGCLLKIDNPDEVEKIMNEEFEVNGFDTLQMKIRTGINLVFMSAKSVSKVSTPRKGNKTQVAK